MNPHRVSVLVCRGCCCGTVAKHPDVDHAGHVERLRAAMPHERRARMWTVDCLGACDHSNVVVVRSDRRRHWLGGMLADRDIDVLAGWLAEGGNGDLPDELIAHEFEPDAAAAVTARMLPPTPEQCADLVERTLVERSGSWSIGVHGATAEVMLDDAEPRVVHRVGLTVTAVSASGAIQLRADDTTHAFVIDRPGEPDRPVAVILAVLITGIAPVRRDIAVVGADADAIDERDRSSTLIDLGLGRAAASFLVRTDDAGLIAVARSAAGHRWQEQPRFRSELRRSGPHRVVLSAIGRAEVYTPIPAAGGEPPAGAHTHLLPGEIDLGLDLPPGITLPNGFTPVALLFPNARWTP